MIVTLKWLQIENFIYSNKYNNKKEGGKKMDDIDMTTMEDEEMLDEIRGETTKKPKLSILNQKKVSNWEMDELFTEEESYEEEF